MTTPINSGWEARYKEIDDKLVVPLMPGPILASIQGLLSEDEINRSLWKIRLIEPFLRRMVLNMIKGSIKYPTDDWSLETWQSMSMDDQADAINYALLEKNHIRKRMEELLRQAGVVEGIIHKDVQ